MPLPTTTQELLDWTWPYIEPQYKDLQARTLSKATVDQWLADWSQLSSHVIDLGRRLYVATTVNTADTQAEQRYASYLDNIQEAAQTREQALKQKLLSSGLEPQGFDIPLRNMRTETAIFSEANLPLLTEDDKLSSQYDKISGAQTVTWEGKDATVNQLRPVGQDPDRARREQAWRLGMERWLVDRAALNDLWVSFVGLRRKLAANAGLGDDYRAYRWRQLLRFDYTPQDAATFHRAIEEVAVPASLRIYERRRKRLGLATLRPWDMEVDPLGRPPLRPFKTVDQLKTTVSSMFHRVDPELGADFDIMQREGLLDLDNRKNKAPGGYCDSFPVTKRPFIFINAVGLHDDVQTLLHEGGHAFHVFESSHLPYVQQLDVGMEFAEVASMGMELLASPYLAAADGGFYSKEDAARALIEHLEWSILFWPYMAVVDSFQHWAYEHPDDALDPANCDAQWSALWRRFKPGVDWSGLEATQMTGWHQKLHIFQYPFYYIEYGLAQLGATQVWANALKDQAASVANYRKALSLGGTVALPQLYAAAGGRFAFDSATLRTAVDLMEDMIAKLEGGQA